MLAIKPDGKKKKITFTDLLIGTPKRADSAPSFFWSLRYSRNFSGHRFSNS